LLMATHGKGVFTGCTCLPPGFKVVGVRPSENWTTPETVEIKVQHHSFPVVQPGDIIPKADACRCLIEFADLGRPTIIERR